MTEQSLKTLIETAISFPVFEGTDTIVYPGATLEISSLPAVLIGDGKRLVRESDVVINIFTQTKIARDEAVTALDEALDLQTGMSVPDIETYYDTTAKKYRAVITFSFIPREES